MWWVIALLVLWNIAITGYTVSIIRLIRDTSADSIADRVILRLQPKVEAHIGKGRQALRERLAIHETLATLKRG